MPKGDPIDTTNFYLVALGGEGVALMRPPLHFMSPDNALVLAAWLVAVVGDDERFAEILHAVQNT